jgi:toxin ParE1/3/4
MPEKSRRIVWTPAAKKDLRGVWRHYVRVASPEIADQMVREIAETGERLAHRALMWRTRDDVGPGLRSVLSHPYVIFYRVSDANVEVLRVLHGRRNFGAVFKRKEP